MFSTFVCEASELDREGLTDEEKNKLEAFGDDFFFLSDVDILSPVTRRLHLMAVRKDALIAYQPGSGAKPLNDF